MEMLGLVVAVFVFAGMVKGALGLGLPTVAMGLLTIVIAPFQAASLLIIPSMITNIWQLFAEGRVWALVQRFWLLLLGIMVGTIFSIFPTLSEASGKTSEILLGSMLVIYGIYGLWVKQLPDLRAYEKWLSPLIGYLGGALIVSTGVIIIPAVPYLQSLRLKRDDLVQALGLVFTLSTICLAIYLQLHSTANMQIDYRLAWAAVIPALLGMWLGQKLRYRIPEQRFRRFFFVGLISLGAYMLLH
ncbi:sulfite exporter TauE/SafE family protein [Acinetobacter ihumii]|uniref:sulfite exporter TauE/SafE family protein n=1 Tax=Acinetobacter ihumii TaxID=2483802 RepID=UPI0010324924|nr:sulfite exporter TauE/SafE family protein [Acinetobacter ihumii]